MSYTRIDSDERERAATIGARLPNTCEKFYLWTTTKKSSRLPVYSDGSKET